MLSCSWKETLGIECPSCGAQRSFEELLHGHFWESIQLFPALFPLIAVVILAIIHLIRPFSSGPTWIVRLFAFSAILMFGNWTLKMIDF